MSTSNRGAIVCCPRRTLERMVRELDDKGDLDAVRADLRRLLSPHPVKFAQSTATRRPTVTPIATYTFGSTQGGFVRRIS
jgi:hypothetical protein